MPCHVGLWLDEFAVFSFGYGLVACRLLTRLHFIEHEAKSHRLECDLVLFEHQGLLMAALEALKVL